MIFLMDCTKKFLSTGYSPGFETWKTLNDKINTSDGAGLMYLLIFKLCRYIHGHANIGDVIWFYKTIYNKLFRFPWSLPAHTC